MHVKIYVPTSYYCYYVFIIIIIIKNEKIRVTLCENDAGALSINQSIKYIWQHKKAK